MDTTEIYHLPGFYEPFSAMSHLFGAVLFFVLGCFLLRRGRGSRRRLIFLGIYVFACVFLLSMSGVYHMLDRPSDGHIVLQRLDHAAIFVLIAGTFTPVHGLLFHGWARWLPLFLIWGLAITGVVIKTVFFHDLHEWLGLTWYLALGWLGVISGFMVARRYGFEFIKPLLWGGAAYSIGAIFDFTGRPEIIPGVVHPHEIFHVAVLIGALYQFHFIWQIAAGRRSGGHTVHPAPPIGSTDVPDSSIVPR